MMKKIFLSIFTILVAVSMSAQTVYTMQNDSVSLACALGGSLNDSGGAGANYSDNENFIFTVCPSTPGFGVFAFMDVLDVPVGDLINIYDGSNTSSPLLPQMPLDNATTFVPGAQFQSTITNSTGCLTFEFISDGDGQTGNFDFSFVCNARCQTFSSGIASSVPDTTSTPTDTYIDVCLGDTVFVNASNNFPNNNIEYPQSNATSTFEWYWYDSTTVPSLGQSQSNFYSEPGGYRAKLISYDVNGCRNFQDQIFKVRIAPDPTFITLTDTILCLGESDTLQGLPEGIIVNGTIVQGETVFFIEPVTSGDSIPLPDGSGINHTSTVQINGFGNSDVIQNCGDVINLCVNLEHSFLGDLEMTLTCPNGTIVGVFNSYSGGAAGELLPGGFSGGTDYLGQPIDANTGNAGLGWEYCFTDGAVNSSWTNGYTTVPVTPQPTSSGINTSTGISIPADNYQPFQAFSGFVGCPVNGPWTLTVRDNIGIDDGFLFNWSLGIDPCMQPDVDSFQMVYDFGSWAANPTIIDIVNDSNTIIIQPAVAGLQQYTYNTANQFGCEYSRDYEIYVEDFSVEAPSDTIVCTGDPVQLSAAVTGISSPLTYNWTPPMDLNNPNIQNPISTLTGGSITYVAAVTSGNNCTFYDTVAVNASSSFQFSAMGDTTICSGDSIQLWATGGAITYDWTPNDGTISDTASATPTVMPAVTTTYRVQADSTGCSQFANIVVSVSNITAFNLPPTNPTCGLSDGSILIFGSGGVGPLTYSNDGGITTQASGVFTALGAGVYPIVISDGSGCDYIDTITLTGGLPLVIDTVIANNPGCGSVGSINTILTNPLVPVTYTLDVGPVAQDSSLFLGLNPGVFTITIDDGVCPSIDTTITLTGGGSVALSIDSSSNVTCFNQADGEIHLSTIGGVAPDFSIDGVNYFPSGSFTSLDTGTYIVYVQEAGCVDSSFVTITQPDSLAFTSVIDSIFCFGESANITISASGGTMPYSYSIDGVPTFTALDTYVVSGGNYALQVMDSNSCLSVIELDTIDQPTQLVLTLDSTRNSDCVATNGAIFTSITGGTAPYLLSIDGGTTTQDSTSFLNLASSMYTVTITDANGCADTVMANVQANASVALNVVSFDSLSCFGDTDAIVQLGTLNGTPAFSFNVDNGSMQADSLFTNLTAGVHGFKVLDLNGCTDSVTVTIFEPAQLTTSFTTDSLTCDESANGQINLTAAGGTSPYVYAVDNIFAPQPIGNFNGLDAGIHIAYIADNNGCLDTINPINVFQPDTFIITGVTVQDILCSGNTNGSFTVAVSGGTNNYQFNLNGGTNQSSNIFNNLTQGIYTINAIDTNGCSASVVDSISVPNALDLTLDSVRNSNCGSADGAIYLDLVGGVGPYSYTLDAGLNTQDSATFINVLADTYFVEVTDNNSCTDTLTVVVQDDATLAINVASFDSVSCFGLDDASVQLSATGGTAPYTFNVDGGLFQTDSLFTNLSGSAHTFIVQDANGCTEPVSISIFEPAILVPSFTTDSLSCDESGDGAIQITLVGGTMPYAYALDNYFAPQATGDFLNLDAGLHVGYVIDANGCQDTITPINVLQPDTFIITNVVVQDINCNGDNNGTITISTSGGTSDFEYNLNGGANQAANAFNTLSGGIFNINAADANGCLASAIDSVFEPTVVVLIEDSLKNVTCFNGNDGYLAYSATGGVGPYTYSKDNGANFQPANSFNFLTAGSYNIVVRDANGCEASLNPTITQSNEIQFIPSSTAVTCAGSTDGIVTINSVSGGNLPYSAIINSSAAVPFVGTYSLGGLQGGINHTVQVIDAEGCVSTVQNVFINQPDSLILSIQNINDVSCNSSGDGSVSLFAQNGTPGYTFSMSVNGIVQTQTGSDTASFSNLSGGQYPVVLTDANACATSLVVDLSEPNALIIDSLQILSQITCFGDDNGSILVHASGGSQFASPSDPYTYVWSPSGDTEHKAGPLGPGVHEVTVTDANGCFVTASETILPVDPIIANINPDSAFMSMGDTLQIGVNVQNAIGNNLQYSWSPTNGLSCSDCANPSVTIYNDIVYSVLVTDSNGCTNYNLTEIFISIDNSLFFFIPNGFTPNGDGVNDVFEVYGQDVKTVEMSVFNRWGERVFQGKNQFEAWDGTFKGVMQGNGVYTYSIDVTFLNDATLFKKGSVSLVR